MRSSTYQKTFLWHSRYWFHLPNSELHNDEVFFGMSSFRGSLGEVLSDFRGIFECVFELFLERIRFWLILFTGVFECFSTSFFEKLFDQFLTFWQTFRPSSQVESQPVFQPMFQPIFRQFFNKIIPSAKYHHKNVQFRVLAISVQHLVSYNYIQTSMYRFKLPDQSFKKFTDSLHFQN